MIIVDTDRYSWMVGNYLTPRLVRTSLLSQKSPLWSIIAMEHPGGVQTWQVTFRFFQRWLENPLERVRWFSQQKTPFFWCFFHVFPIFYGCHFPVALEHPTVASHGVPIGPIGAGERGNEAHHCRLQRLGDLQRESEGWLKRPQSLDLFWGPVLGHQDISSELP